jgi:hypothetical protein
VMSMVGGASATTPLRNAFVKGTEVAVDVDVCAHVVVVVVVDDVVVGGAAVDGICCARGGELARTHRHRFGRPVHRAGPQQGACSEISTTTVEHHLQVVLAERACAN